MENLSLFRILLSSCVLGLCVCSTPFNVYWNVPSERCLSEYGVPVEDLLRKYHITVNRGGDGWRGERVTIFYSNQLGLYPYIADNGTLVYGGVPQAVNLSQHLQKVVNDIDELIPLSNFTGLGIIDWEAWRPLWERNWDAKLIYQQLSEKLVEKQHPSWNLDKVKVEAERQFDAAARNMMVETLKVAKNKRPGGKWGYYLFPDCFNYGGKRNCTDKAKMRNDKLSWLFNTSTSLYPSAYFQGLLNTSDDGNFVFGQLEEARRVRGTHTDTPVLLYSRFTYTKNHTGYYSMGDMYASVAQAAILGAEGVVLWDDHNMESTAEVCKELYKFIYTIMGPCVEASMAFTEECSSEMCHSHGRCALNVSNKGRMSLWRRHTPTMTEITSIMNSSYTSDIYNCECFQGWSGGNCSEPTEII